MYVNTAAYWLNLASHLGLHNGQQRPHLHNDEDDDDDNDDVS